MNRRKLTVACLLALVGGCHTETPEEILSKQKEQARKQLENLESWYGPQYRGWCKLHPNVHLTIVEWSYLKADDMLPEQVRQNRQGDGVLEGAAAVAIGNSISRR